MDICLVIVAQCHTKNDKKTVLRIVWVDNFVRGVQTKGGRGYKYRHMHSQTQK